MMAVARRPAVLHPLLFHACCWPALLLTKICAAAELEASSAAATWRLEWANDVFLDSDNQFTNGFSIQKHSRRFSRLADTFGTPAFGKRLARAFLPEGEGLAYREGWAFGQNIQTPDDLARSDLITDDVPYAGMVAWANSFTAADDDRFVGFEMLFGWVGPDALAEEAQKLVHDLLDSDRPNGWDNQLDSEPVVNFYYARKRKIARTERVDVAVNFDAALGNFLTFAQASLDIRFGGVPEGFASTPEPIGRGVNYDAAVRTAGQRYFYGSFTLRGVRFLSALLGEGNSFTNDNPWTELNTIRMNSVVVQAGLGVHIERPSWGIHVYFWRSTDTYDRDTLTAAEDADNSYGTITIEWRR